MVQLQSKHLTEQLLTTTKINMAYITRNELYELNEWQAEVRNAYGECLIDDDGNIKYTAEPSEDLTEGERRQSLEGLLNHIADIIDDSEEDFEEDNE
mgnify:FL=1